MARADQVYFRREAAERKMGFARAVKAGGWLFISGCTATGPDGKVAGVGDMQVQTERVYQILEEVLRANGASWEHVVKEVMYATDLDAFVAATPVRLAVYKDVAPPAATGVEVSRLVHPDMLVEVELTAYVPES
jgi:enamine deaminase RidA (YjgF/YER057c/UK114 family)